MHHGTDHADAALAILLHHAPVGRRHRGIGVDVGQSGDVHRRESGSPVLVERTQDEALDVAVGIAEQPGHDGDHTQQQTHAHSIAEFAEWRRRLSTASGGEAEDRLAGVSDLTIRAEWFGPQALPYLEAWDLQRQLLTDRAADRIDDVALFLEHPAVYTAGRRTEPHERPQDGTAVIDVDRGGKITFHGPGQLVGYPITKLPSHVLVVDYVRRVEEALIRTCADFGVTTGRVPGRSGVWLAAGHGNPERKIAAIGIRVARGVTMHGFSLNADVSMDAYDRFIPCGISDAGVTSLSLELGRPVDVREAADAVAPHLVELLRWEPYTSSPDLDQVPALAVPVLEPA